MREILLPYKNRVLFTCNISKMMESNVLRSFNQVFCGLSNASICVFIIDHIRKKSLGKQTFYDKVKYYPQINEQFISHNDINTPYISVFLSYEINEQFMSHNEINTQHSSTYIWVLLSHEINDHDVNEQFISHFEINAHIPSHFLHLKFLVMKKSFASSFYI